MLKVSLLAAFCTFYLIMLILPIPYTPFIFLSPGSHVEGHYYLLGTDQFGRDLAMLLIQGLCISLGTGFIATLLAGSIGLFLGLMAATSSKTRDRLFLKGIELKLSIPTLLMALLAHITFGQSIITLTLAMGLSGWAYLALMARSIGKTEASLNYFNAARLLGLHPLRIILTHLLPNCFPPLVPFLTYRYAHFVLLESSLSFLGLGLPQNQLSLGLLMNSGMDDMLSGHYWVIFFPAILLSLVIVSIHAAADYLNRK